VAHGAGIVLEFDVGGFVDFAFGVLAGTVEGVGFEVGWGQVVDGVHEAGRAHAEGEEFDAAFVEFAEHGVGGDLLVHDEYVRVGAGGGFPVLAEGNRFTALGGFGHLGVAVDQVVGVAVSGEEGEYGAGPLGAGGHVVFLQDGVFAPVHDGMEVQVKDGLLGGGQPAGDQLGVQAEQEGALVVVAGAVGVAGQG